MQFLDQELFLRTIDIDNIISDVYNLPDHAEQVVKQIVGLNTHAIGSINKIVYCGMGGSGISGDLIEAYVRDTAKVPFMVNKGYKLPAFVENDTLVICVSYSGNTEETLSIYEETRLKNVPTLVVTSGGILLDKAIASGDYYIEVPSGLQPRVATGYIFFGILTMLAKFGLIEVGDELDNAITLLKRMRDEELNPSIPTNDNIAKQIATQLKGKLPVIHATDDVMGPTALRWKQQINEMAKNLAFHNVYPELSHNELVSYEFPNNIADDTVIISLRSDYDHERNQLRREICEKEILGYDVSQVIQVNAWGKSKLAQMVSLMYIGDYAATYLAILNHIDPSQIAKMNELKDKMKSYKLEDLVNKD